MEREPGTSCRTRRPFVISLPTLQEFDRVWVNLGVDQRVVFQAQKDEILVPVNVSVVGVVPGPVGPSRPNMGTLTDGNPLRPIDLDQPLATARAGALATRACPEPVGFWCSDFAHPRRVDRPPSLPA